MARVRTEKPAFVADLGCGPGNLTRTLADRWPAAIVVGVDNSPEMLVQAQGHSIKGRLTFVEADIVQWSPARPVDLFLSNAALQWVDGHEALLHRLAGFMAPGGTLAIQLPFHFQNPAHVAIEEAKADPRWRDELQGVGLRQSSVRPLVWYAERLLDLNFTVDAWQTTYLHVLTGENPVLEWFKGSALRPLLERLAPESKDAFLCDVGNRFKAAYPARGDITLLPFPRLFLVATLP
jgi:trans-aconitate 2-methyltransferase